MTDTALPRAETDSPYAAARLLVTLAIMTIGASGMYVVPVVLPEVQFSRLPDPPAGIEVAGLDLVIRLRPAR